MLRRLIIAMAIATIAIPLFAAGKPANEKFLRTHGRRVDGQYIVVLNNRVGDVDALASDLVAMHRGRKQFVYHSAIKGFSAQLSEAAAMAIANNPLVEYVEEDAEVNAVATQSGATWGIDRVDQRDLPLSGTYTYNYTGSGVKAYIIDTGIKIGHTEFGSRRVTGYDAVTAGGNADDCNGHGTHVSGTVGGATYGIAKSVTLVAVRVLDCSGSGTNSGVIAGVNWVTSDHVAGAPAVANMSLGGGASQALDDAVNSAINDGVTFAIAAGNDNLNACNYSPARVAAAITVGATTSSDARASYSNYGTCLDIFAPGSSITSAWYTSTTATNTISGTSMATPHVTGVAALYLQQYGYQSPATVRNAIVNASTPNKVTSAGTGSPNQLLYSLFGTTPPPPPPPSGSQLLANPGFESGNNGSWTITSGVIDNSTSAPARTGSWKAWLCGYGSTHTDYAYQQVSIPSTATSATLSYYLRITTSESGSTAYDNLSVQILNSSGTVLATLRTYSNANSGSYGSYTAQSFDVSSYKGQTIRVRFYATEDSSLQTSFLVDDTALNVQ